MLATSTMVGDFLCIVFFFCCLFFFYFAFLIVYKAINIFHQKIGFTLHAIR